MIHFYGTVIDQNQDLPSIPMILTKLLRLLTDSSTATKDIARIISLDPALTLKIISLANSAMFGSVSEIVDINHAIMRLGRNEIKNIVMTIYVANLLNQLKPNMVDLDRFWKHSLSVAFISKKLYGYLLPEEKKDQDELLESYLYIGGILHDIAILLLDVIRPEEFAHVYEIALEEEYSWVLSERKTLQYNHAEEGYNLLLQRNIPEEIADIVRYHHAPDFCNNRNCLGAYIVHSADYIANSIGYSTFLLNDFEQASQNSLRKFVFGDKNTEELKDIFSDMMNQSTMFLSYAELAIRS